MRTNFRDGSKRQWSSENNLTIAEINCGSMQRIADACEKMCTDRDSIERRLGYAQVHAEQMQRLLDTEKRRSAALRGVISRLRKKQEGKQDER